MSAARKLTSWEEPDAQRVGLRSLPPANDNANPALDDARENSRLGIFFFAHTSLLAREPANDGIAAAKSEAPRRTTAEPGITGKEEDVEVGLQYFGKRYLNPLLGRWISADPLAVHAPGEADLNVYAYVSGQILRNVDPLGLDNEARAAAEASNEQLSGELTQLEGDRNTLLNERSLAVEAGADDSYLSAFDAELKANEELAASIVNEISLNREIIRSNPLQIDIGSPSQGGDPEYYQKREEDFKARNPGAEPPEYYTGYGDKYLKKFTTLRGKLGAQGQGFVTLTRWELQHAFEERIALDPEGFAQLEMDSDAHRAFAFDTHPDAYLDGGLAQLSWGERLQVAGTPDKSDLLKPSGIKQAIQTGVVVLADDMLSSGAFGLDMGWQYSGPAPGVLLKAAEQGK
jgi:RHS repeat-associated protein